ELAGEVDGVRELVGVHANQADKALAARAPELAHDAVDPDPRVGLVGRRDGDLDIRPENGATPAVLSQAIERGQTAVRNMRTEPGDRITVVVVVRRLDQQELKSSRHCAPQLELTATTSCGGIEALARLLPSRTVQTALSLVQGTGRVQSESATSAQQIEF